MTSVGGYFASLDLVTNASSFERARKYLNQISGDALIAASSMEELQAKVAKNAQSFFGAAKSSGNPNQYTQMAGFKMNTESGYMIGDDTEKEEQKRTQKRDSVTKLASLFVLLKVIAVLKDLTTKIAKLTFAVAQANMKAVGSSGTANMSPNAIKAWSMVAKVHGVDPSSMVSKFTDFNQAFEDLQQGVGDAYGKISSDIALLSEFSGLRIDPKELITMSNDERISAIDKALRAAHRKDPQQADLFAHKIFGSDYAKILSTDMAAGVNSYNEALASIMAPLSKQDAKTGVQFGLLKATLDDTFNLLGQVIAKEFVDDVMLLRDWLKENKDRIRKVFETFGTLLHAFVKAFVGIIDVLAAINSGINDLIPKDTPGGNEYSGRFWRLSTDDYRKATGTSEGAYEEYYGSGSPILNLNMNVYGVTGAEQLKRQTFVEALEKALRSVPAASSTK